LLLAPIVDAGRVPSRIPPDLSGTRGWTRVRHPVDQPPALDLPLSLAHWARRRPWHEDRQLLKSSRFPDKTAPTGLHRFSYVLKPRRGDSHAAALSATGTKTIPLPLRASSPLTGERFEIERFPVNLR